MMRSGAAVIALAKAAPAVTSAKHDTAVRATTPRPVIRIATTDVTAAAIAASSTLGAPETPGTAMKPATAANAVAIRLRVSPAMGSRAARCAVSRAMSPAVAAIQAVAPT